LSLKLPKDQILRGRGAFAFILAKGKSVGSGSVKLFFAPATETTRPRIGFAVLRGIKNAAVRNRIKRCLREAFRLHQHQLPARFGGIVLLYVGKTPRQSSEIDCTSVERDVRAVLERLSRKEQ
jgi:ribonuclease P protein component